MDSDGDCVPFEGRPIREPSRLVTVLLSLMVYKRKLKLYEQVSNLAKKGGERVGGRPVDKLSLSPPGDERREGELGKRKAESTNYLS